jgi:hypothetical protein
MTFSQALMAAMRRAGTPLRSGTGEEDAIVANLIEALRKWVAAHLPEDGDDSEFDAGYRALAVQLLDELEGSANLPEGTTPGAML